MDRRADLPDLSDEEAQTLVRRIRTEIAGGKARAASATMALLLEELLRRLRRIVWPGYPNRGEDIIVEALDRIMVGICKPRSADAIALSTNFRVTVFRRALDAIEHYKKLRHRSVSYDVSPSGELRPPKDETHASGVFEDRSMEAEINEREGTAWAEAQIAAIEDDATRLAIRLHMDGMNIEKGEETIAKALGCDPKTVRSKIKRGQDILKAKLKREGW